MERAEFFSFVSKKLTAVMLCRVACAKGGLWKKALSLLDEMRDKGIAPTEVTYR